MAKIGVYKICSISGKFYYGSSVDMDERSKQHVRDLVAGTHVNVFMQRVYNKHGLDGLTISYKELSSIEEARALEQKLLDKYCRTKNCMNIALNSCGGDNLSNNPNRDEIVSRIRKSLIDKTSNMTEAERIAKYGRSGPLNGMYGRTHTDEVRKAQSIRATGQVGSMRGKKIIRRTKT